jgi:hypothetical protein
MNVTNIKILLFKRRSGINKNICEDVVDDAKNNVEKHDQVKIFKIRLAKSRFI